VLLLGSSAAIADGRPEWTGRNTQSISGKMFHAVCSGTGPSTDLARREAKENCLVAASQQLTTTVQAKSVAAESEKGIVFHSEVAEEQGFTGLTCVPGREFIEETQNQSHVWIECTFDLAKAKMINAADKPTIGDEKSNSSWVSVKSDQSTSPATTTKPSGRYISSDVKTLTLSVVPRCYDLLIRGDKPVRVVKCQSDPVTITVQPDENEIIVRATGFLPKTIHLNEKREGNEYVQIFLDPAD